MNVWLPYTNIQPITRFCFFLQNLSFQEWPIDDTNTYSHFFQERWRDKKKFINVEQDTAFWPGSIQAIWNCPEPWCAYGYVLDDDFNHPAGNAIPYLGLAKFDTSFIEAAPDLWDSNPYWLGIDVYMINFIRENYPTLKVHQHFPAVINANPFCIEMVDRSAQLQTHFNSPLIP